MSAAIDVTVPKPGVVQLEVVVGPVAFKVQLTPRSADSLAGAIQRGAIEANAPARKLQLVTPAPLPATPPAANT